MNVFEERVKLFSFSKARDANPPDPDAAACSRRRHVSLRFVSQSLSLSRVFSLGTFWFGVLEALGHSLFNQLSFVHTRKLRFFMLQEYAMQACECKNPR